MEITKTEVFECQKCGSISKKKMDIEKCIKEHKRKIFKRRDLPSFESYTRL